MLELYLDEAGYTGSDLLNRDQPVYSLAAVTLSAETAHDLVIRCFPNVKAKELRHSALSSRSRGRRQIVDFINALAKYPNSASVVAHHKENVLLGLLVDYWVEPAVRLDGINLYENGGNIALVNLTYITLTALLGVEGRREFLRRFQVMVRDRTIFAYESFWDTVSEAYHQQGDSESVFGMYLAANVRLGRQYLWKLLGTFSTLAIMGSYRL